jgi:hypothetical protein
MTAKKPDPAQAEAEASEFVKVPFRDETFMVARDVSSLPFDYALAIDDGRWGHACRYLLGAEYPRWIALEPTAAEGMHFMRAHEVALGLRSGE